MSVKNSCLMKIGILIETLVNYLANKKYLLMEYEINCLSEVSLLLINQKSHL